MVWRENHAMDEDKNFVFKDAIKKIEEIVQALEDDTIDLDVALKKYEAGVKLIRKCNEYLNQAELRLKELTRDQDGAMMKDLELEND